MTEINEEQDLTYNATNSEINVNPDGVITGDLNGYGTSILNIKGGHLQDDLKSYDNCKITIDSGTIDGGLGIYGSGGCNWYGGSIGGRITVGNDETETVLNIHGSDFKLHARRISGKLSDNTEFNIPVSISPGSVINLIISE